MDRTGIIFFLLLLILFIFLFTTGRLQATFDALAAKKELAANG